MFKKLLISSAILLLSACSSSPDWDYDQSIEFANYKTFAWAPNAALKASKTDYQINDLMEKRVRTAIKQSLSTQGMRMVEADTADVLVNYHASVESKIESSTLNTHYGVRWNYWGWGMQSQTTAKEYDVGTLVIDVIDNASQQLIWRGAKEGRLRSKQTPEQRTASINKTVGDILQNFPPKVQY
ncbi:hypothetical protein PSECIP111951_02653 [Pseudoalteromonas holothuriae]|uniref:DUF4136 domain-containing protein n=1 Tax=Pseudoalteromonas holothuriae TaxID=2963714 RepID=A0A9W4VZJ1_9GAMM|nr:MULTISPECIES: DUF4136 domain-containing protein [unclassified Pseudoalteromonas]CAH9062245.1 hypothetical protein PSECIP111951_02653 [Pseudoalteromonas sp. CIP111951]CAH9065640.1 hypothetical protein PSECIP111854_03724 [Pseudoalteromonas sp. CIP111854]